MLCIKTGLKIETCPKIINIWNKFTTENLPSDIPYLFPVIYQAMREGCKQCSRK